MADSDWLLDFDLPASRDHLEAVGAFALLHNRLETCLYGLIRHFVGPEAPATSLYVTLHNRARVDLIKSYLEGEKDAEAKKVILAALTAIDICIENRNLLLHGLPVIRNGEHLSLWKGAKNSGTLKQYLFTLEHIREAATDADRAREHTIHLVLWLKARHDHPERPEPLPETPPQPRKLSLSQLEANPKGD